MLENISSLKDIRELNNSQLKELSEQIREYIIRYVSENGGYLADNLSIVEIFLMLYYLMDVDDEVFFDYDLDLMSRAVDKEYKADNDNVFSKALASAVTNNKDTFLVLNIDKLSKGNNLELLNQLCSMETKLIIICNDNTDNQKVNIFDRIINNARNASYYRNLKKSLKNSIKPVKYGDVIIENIHKAKDTIKKIVVDEGFFKSFDIDYIGPVDGHNLRDLKNAIELSKNKESSVVIHTITKSGKGYRFAENDNSDYYSYIDKFNIETGRLLNDEDDIYKRVNTLISYCLGKQIENNKDICIISDNSQKDCLNTVYSKYPESCINCELSDRNKIDFAMSLSDNGKIPFITVNQKDLNDLDILDRLNNSKKSMIISCTKQNDDFRFIRYLYNCDIFVPSSSDDLKEFIDKAIKSNRCNIILYPDKLMPFNEKNDNNLTFGVGKWHFLVNNDMRDVVILSYGDRLNMLKQLIEKNEFNYSLIDCSNINLYDKDIIDSINTYKHIYMYGKLFNHIDIDGLDSSKSGVYDDSIDGLFAKISRGLNA